MAEPNTSNTGTPAPGATATAPAGQDQKTPEFYQAEAKRAFEARDAAKSELAAMQKRLEALESEKSKRDAADADAKHKAEMAKMESQGEFQKALEATNARHAQEKSEMQRQHEETIKKALLPATIRAAALDIPDLTPEAARDLPMLIGSQIGIDPLTGAAFVIGANGEQLKDPETLKPVTLQEHIKKFVSDRPYMLKDRMQKGTGLTQGATVASESFTVDKALADPMVLVAWKKADQEGCAKAFQEHWNNAPQRAEAKFKS